jgi:hypothetical protein
VFGRKELESDAAAERRVISQVHHADAAGAQPASDPIVSLLWVQRGKSLLDYVFAPPYTPAAFHRRKGLRMRIRLLPAFGVLLAGLVLPAAVLAADRVSGNITRTFVIVEDTDLVGDVTCDVGNNTPCFSFGAPNVELRLNGYTITGRGDAVTGCGGTAANGEAGIITNSMSGVVVRGPGMVQRFRGDGITVGGSRNARIEGLTFSTNCMSGVRVLATAFGTLVQGNIAVRNGSSNPGLPCGGI